MINTNSGSGVADQSQTSQTSGCFVTSGRCWPSAAEECYSSKRSSNTVCFMTFTHIINLDRPLSCYLKLGQGEVQDDLADRYN